MRFAVFGALLLGLTLGWSWWRLWKNLREESDRAYRRWCRGNARIPPHRIWGLFADPSIDRMFRTIGRRM